MLRHIVAFEWRYQVRSPVFWVGCALFFLLTFGSVTVGEIQIGDRGNVFVNAPYAIMQTLAIMSLFSIFVIVAIVANVVIRDDETGFAPILRSTSVSKLSYLVGRFVGASGAALCVLAMVPLAIAIGSTMPWLDPEKVGPFRLVDHLYALFAFGLPTLLIISAGYFALATATRSMMWTYVGATATLVLYIVMRGLVRDTQFDNAAALADPFGLSALRVATKYWTAAERNTMLPPLSGVLLANRVLWSVVALALFVVAYHRFRFEQRSATMRVGGREAPASAPRAVPRTTVLPATRADTRTRWEQLWRLVRFDVAFVVRNPAFFVLVGLGVLNSMGSLWFAGRWYGSDSYPVTRVMVEALAGAFTLFPIIIAVFYAGELVWRDRERRMHEIVDATSAPDWAHLVPKILAITLVLGVTSLAAVATGMVVQLLKGYTQVELGGYLLWFALPMVIGAVLLAVLSVFVQVLVPHKYLGWGVMLIYIVATVALTSAGFEHNLYNYGGASPVPLSDMNGMAHFWVGRAWFEVYWGAFALILTVVAFVLWRRGATIGLRPRVKHLRSRLHRRTVALLAAGVLAWAGSGVFIYYNTNRLNRYVTAPERDAVLASFEKQFLRHEKVPQPRITAVTLDVQLYPREVRAVTTGSYRIQNRTSAPIDTLHLTYGERLVLDRVELAGATLDKDWPDYHYRIYKLTPAMQPDEIRELRFATTLVERGFPNSAPLTRIVANGSFLDNSEITPSIGLSRQTLLKDRAKRRKHGLPVDMRPPTLEDETGRAHNVLRFDSDWIDADITVTTDADQTPIAPGYTVSDTTADGRRTVRFKPDAPINHFFSIQSARYEVRRDVWQGVDLAVYFHPGHDYNVARMLTAMKASLALFSEQFSPFQFRQARILEFPSYATFAQSFANTIPYSENIGFLLELGAPDEIDVITYVTAHEIAHQWWGHQLLASEQQGATMLIESFAQYSALLTMERLYGREQIRKFLKYELDRYLRSRGGEVVEELPLARVEDQPYIHYQKGALVMYWLKEVVSEATVNGALAALLTQYALKPPPYPNTLDFLRLLRTMAGPQHDALITDLFEKITLVDAKASSATAVARPDGKYEITLEVNARKLHADGKGVETESPLDEPFDIGVFTAEPGKPGFTAESVLYMQRHPIHSGKQTITVIVDKRPAFAGVDPYNKRIDRNSDDNLAQVDVKAPPSAR